MATKKFIIEVEEGCVPSCEICPFAVNGMLCKSYGIEDDGLLNCNKYNLSTMKIQEYEDAKTVEIVNKACKWLEDQEEMIGI